MIRIFLKNKKLRNGKRAIVLSITKNKRRKVFSLGISCKDNEWNKRTKTVRSQHPESVQYNEIIRKNKSKAELIISDFNLVNYDFTLEDFEKKFRNLENEKVYFYSYFEQIIVSLFRSGKIGTSETFKTTISSLREFTGNSPLLNKVDFDFLMQYEEFLRIDGHTDGGIAFKMRVIRRVLKLAMESGLITHKDYPFDKYKISKLKAGSRKIAMSLKELRKFEKVNVSTTPDLLVAQKLFMFSFYSRGMNWGDMISITYDQIRDGKIKYKRRKTQKQFIIELLPPMWEIIEFFKNDNSSETDYLFPILPKEEISIKKFRYYKYQSLKVFNKHLGVIAKKAKIDKKITSYVARHSFATIMKYKNVPIDVICELMGHSNVNVTMSYLKEFEDETLDKYARNLLEEDASNYNILIKMNKRLQMGL